MEGRNRSGWYTAQEVRQHCLPSDCWLILLGHVLDVSPLLASNPPHLAQPLLLEAGEDISHWFDPATGDIKTYIHPITKLPTFSTPQGRFIHIPPPDCPRTDWDCSYELPWWKDKQYIIGRLSEKTRLIRIKNVLTGLEAPLEVPSEETIREILERYAKRNSHAQSYTWKGISTTHDKIFSDLNMDKTLAENGISDESNLFMSLGLASNHHIPVIHVYFNDDLTPL
ncbi:hypothetical protein GOP47_0019076 [Adiantum capillus-veneris]|uniref:Cytochrome b5 domain-containing protein 1 n=1 Tax=Adiantum capillus-veneris TaxID=13818 RepID=A0A9D4UEX0_ADICA|nr:hypothetical protein GOP47_0019076 [Adiantum capillus-veneris]